MNLAIVAATVLMQMPIVETIIRIHSYRPNFNKNIPDRAKRINDIFDKRKKILDEMGKIENTPIEDRYDKLMALRFELRQTIVALNLLTGRDLPFPPDLEPDPTVFPKPKLKQ